MDSITKRPDTPEPLPLSCVKCGKDAPVRWLAGQWRRQDTCAACIIAIRESEEREQVRERVVSAITAAGYPRLLIEAAQRDRREVPDALSRLRYASLDAPSWAHLVSPMGVHAIPCVIAWHARVVARAVRLGVAVPSAVCISEHLLFDERRPSREGRGADVDRCDILVVHDAGQARASEWVRHEWASIVSQRVGEGLPTITISPDAMAQLRGAHYTESVRQQIAYAMRGRAEQHIRGGS